VGIQSYTSGLLHLFFPQLCAGCHRPLLREETLLCLGCNLELPRCGFHDQPDNAAAARLAGRIPFQHATSFAHFVTDGLLQHLLHRMKYQGQKSIGRQLGRLFAWDLEQTSWHKEIDLIIPVPLHPKKERQRGYNQSALIAGSMAAVWGIAQGEQLLRRVRFTESQTKKSREERIANVAGAFALPKPEKLRGKHILLLDDVLTTGATLEAAAQALLQVPDVKISIATIALAA